MSLTLEEFEERYARWSGTTAAELHRLGRFAKPCDCGEEGCEGWAMVHAETITEYVPRHPALPAIDHSECVKQPEFQYHRLAHTHQGLTGFWLFPDETS